MNKIITVIIFTFSLTSFLFSQDYEKMEDIASSTEIIKKTVEENTNQKEEIDTLILTTKISGKNIELKVEDINYPNIYYIIYYVRRYSQVNGFYMPRKFVKYIDNEINGLIVTMTYHGFIESQFRDNQKNGYEREYLLLNKDTVLIGLKEYKDGVAEGPEFWFYDNGKLFRSFHNKKGMPEGPVVEYFQNGVVKLRGKCKGFFWYVRNKDNNQFGWHRNNFSHWVKGQKLEAGGVTGIPEYLPQNLYNVSSGYKYLKRIGKWEFYDINGNLIKQKEYNRNGYLK